MSGGRESGATDVWIGDLYRRHAGWLKRRLRRRFGDDAEDFAQEAWRRLIARYGEAGGVGHPRALLLKIATNTGLDAVRRGSPAKPAAVVPGWSPATQEAQESAVLLEQIILGLPDDLRDVFVLSRFGGLTNVQIAERLGIRPKTVEWRMTRALALCAARLRR